MSQEENPSFFRGEGEFGGKNNTKDKDRNLRGSNALSPSGRNGHLGQLITGGGGEYWLFGHHIRG